MSSLLSEAQLQVSYEVELDHLEKLKSAAKIHISCSKMYLSILQSLSETDDSEKNSSFRKTLENGSYYLQSAYHLVQLYKGSIICSIDDENIQLVNNMLVTLEFDPRHISSGYIYYACGEVTEYFVSKGQESKYYNLLHSQLKKDIRSFIKMVELNIDIPVKRFLKLIIQRLQSISSKMLHHAIENHNLLDVENCIDRGIIVNFKDSNGRTPLHHAVNNGNIDIVKTLLKNRAEINEITDEGKTMLHIASLKGCTEVVEVLLQYISHNKLHDFINAQTTSDGTTSLHIAAKNSFLEIVKSLLKNGAIYNIENNEGKIPLDFSKDQKIINLLNLVDELFKDVKDNNTRAFSKILTLKSDEFLVIKNARNDQGNTLIQVTTANNKPDITESKLLQMTKVPYQIESQPSLKSDWDFYPNLFYKQLNIAVQRHLSMSEMYLNMLQSDSEKNPNPWKTLKEGSYYLSNAYNLVEVYKDFVPGPANDKNIQSVYDTLVTLEFDPKHISSGYTDEVYGGMAECFVSKGQGTKYYNLLHSELQKDVRSFIKMVELNIDIPIKKLLESIEQSL